VNSDNEYARCRRAVINFFYEKSFRSKIGNKMAVAKTPAFSHDHARTNGQCVSRLALKNVKEMFGRIANFWHENV
jgi:hypothetical protein